MLIMPLVMYSVNICGREFVNFSAFTGQSNIPVIWGKASFVVNEDTRHRNKCLNSNLYAQHNVCNITQWLHHSIRSVYVCVNVCMYVCMCAGTHIYVSAIPMQQVVYLVMDTYQVTAFTENRLLSLITLEACRCFGQYCSLNLLE